MSITEININDCVKVRLTQDGLARHRKYFCDLAASAKIPMENIMPVLKPDIDGQVEFQLWELMQIFGAEMYNGNPRQMFIKNKIRILQK